MYKDGVQCVKEHDEHAAKLGLAEKERVKQNAIRLARNHRETCDDENCNISLHLLRRCVELAGIQLTEAEKAEFW